MGEKEQAPAGRLESIDALRGFDMFWIAGGEGFVNALVIWTGWSFRETIEDQLEHVPWEGFHFYDLIFPLFLFLVGVFLINQGAWQRWPECRAWTWRLRSLPYLHSASGVHLR